MLLDVMKRDKATEESLSFVESFSKEAAYLAAIDRSMPSDGFTVGEVIYPFRTVDSKTLVIVNPKSRIIDVTDRALLRRIDCASSREFRSLWHTRLRCIWSEPQGYDFQPGAGNETEILVAFPVKDTSKGATVAKAYVAFTFSFPGRMLLGTRLDFVERVSE